MTSYSRLRRRVVVAATALALGATTLVALPAEAADPQLLSQGRPVRASAVENNDPELVARNAVDGSLATRWGSHHADPQWIWVDLQQRADVVRVQIDWEAAYSTAYTVDVSDDAVSWTTLAAVDPADGGTDVLEVDGRGRYLRVHGTAHNAIAGHSIWELQVFGTPVPDPAETEPDPEPTKARQDKDAGKETEKEQASPTPPPASPTPDPSPSPTPSERPVPERKGPPGSVVYYVVKKAGGAPEKIEGIAGRFLGDKERWPEIADLTEGHRQPDGTFLTDPHTLRAGWVLRLPEDAVGKGVKFGPLPGFDPSTASPSPSPATATATAAPAVAEDGAPAGNAAAFLLPAGLVLGGLLILAALVLLVIRLVRTAARRRRDRVPFDDSVLRTDTSAAWTVDHALRALIAACDREGLTVPGVTGVFIEGSSLRLRLTNPASPAPEPWAVSEDGQSWLASLSALQGAQVSTGSTAQFSRLVNLGMGEAGRVLVDFSLARGLIGLDGSVRARHEALRRWLGEFTGNPWSGEPRVVMVGDGLPRPEQVEHLPVFDQVRQEMEVGDGGILVLSQVPSSADREFLAERFADPAFRWVVIVLGSCSTAKWRFTARDDGWLVSGFLPDVRFDEQAAVRSGRN